MKNESHYFNKSSTKHSARKLSSGIKKDHPWHNARLYEKVQGNNLTQFPAYFKSHQMRLSTKFN